MLDHISVKGARANNLKNIDVTIPRDKLVVLTGLSGSGKSSLAFDTIYADGQRRYVESLSSYARQFLGQMEKPNVDSIEGLSPAISIDQKTTSKNPRSTVGTVTEIYDYLRLLWARVGTPHCPKCGKEIQQQTIDQIIDQVMALPPATRIQVMAPVIRGKKGEHLKIFEDARKSGYVRVRADGSIYDLTEEIRLDKNKKHNIEVVVDRLVIKEDMARRLTDSVEIAANLSGGLVVVNIVGEDRDILFSQNYACEDCGISIEELSPRMFSFNNPFGACPTCTGLGAQLKVDPALIIPNPGLSILEGAITASGWNNVKSDSISRMYFEALAQKYKFKLNTPVKDLPPEVLDVILYGTKGEKLKLTYDRANGQGTLYQAFEGVVNNLERRYRETQSDGMRRELEECMTERPCPDCGGKRLRKEALAVTVGGISIYAFCQKPVTEALAFVDALELSAQKMLIAARILKEIKSRLGDCVYSVKERETLEEAVVKLLHKYELTVTTAESCTGGLLAGRLVNVPGASEVFREGFITYSNKSKRKYLEVSKSTLKKYGAVSPQTAREMATGGVFATDSDACVAVTGIAGPDGGTEDKPVGLVYIAAYMKDKVKVEEYRFKGNRAKIREQAVVKALDLLRRSILENYR